MFKLWYLIDINACQCLLSLTVLCSKSIFPALFLAHLYESTGCFCCHPDVGVGIGMDIVITL